MTRLIQIKLLHTAVWCFFAGCIVAIPIVGGRGHDGWAAVLIGLVLAECGVLAANRGRRPLTGMAARPTEQRAHASEGTKMLPEALIREAAKRSRSEDSRFRHPFLVGAGS